MSAVIEDYSEKAIAIFGETKDFKESLLTLGGKYNPSLRGTTGDTKRAGWIFPKSKRSQVEALLSSSSNSTEKSLSDNLKELKVQPLLNASKQSTVSIVKSTTNNSNVDTNTQIETLKKLVMQLTSRVEAVESELSAVRSLLSSSTSTSSIKLPSTVSATSNKATNKRKKQTVEEDDDEEVEDNQDENDDPPQVFKSLLKRK